MAILLNFAFFAWFCLFCLILSFFAYFAYLPNFASFAVLQYCQRFQSFLFFFSFLVCSAFSAFAESSSIWSHLGSGLIFQSCFSFFSHDYSLMLILRYVIWLCLESWRQNWAVVSILMLHMKWVYVHLFMYRIKQERDVLESAVQIIHTFSSFFNDK